MPDSNETKRKRRAHLKETNPEYVKTLYRKDNLWHHFRMTPEEYDALLEKQKGLCAICERHFSNFKRRLAVDHCHHTGKIRGLLCASCNSGLGKLQDDIEYLKAAINYLNSTGPRYLTEVARVPDVLEIT